MVTLQRNGDRGWRIKDTKTGGQFYFLQEDTYDVLNMLEFLNSPDCQARGVHSIEHKSSTGRIISWFKAKQGGYLLQTQIDTPKRVDSIYVPREDAERMLKNWQRRICLWSSKGDDDYTKRNDKGGKI